MNIPLRQPRTPDSSESLNHPRQYWFWLTACLLVIVFLATDHTSFLVESEMHPSILNQRWLTGENIERFGYLLFGLLGSALLFLPERRTTQGPYVPVGLLTIYGILCAGFLLGWIAVGSRGSFALACIPLGVFGLARQFSVRELTKLVLVVMSLHLVCGILWEMLMGRFSPQHAEYRFAGTLSPDVQGLQCCLLALSALAMLRHTRHYLPLHLSSIAMGILFLLLTKSPISCCAFLVALMVELALQAKSSRPWRMACLAVLVILVANAIWNPGWVSAGLRNLGAIGIAAWSLVVILGIRQAGRRYSLTHDEGYRFLAAQIAVGCLFGMLMGPSWLPGFFLVIGLSSLVSLALTPMEQSATKGVTLAAARTSLPTPVAG